MSTNLSWALTHDSTDLGVEVNALVVVKVELASNCEDTVDILLAWVKLRARAVAWVDPNVVRWVLVAQSARWHRWDPVATIDDRVELVTNLLVNERSKCRVTNTGKSKQIRFVQTTVHTQLNIHSAKQTHSRTKRVTNDSHALFILLLLVLLNGSEDIIHQVIVRLLETVHKLCTLRVVLNVTLVGVFLPELRIMQVRVQREKVRALDGDSNTKARRVIDVDTLASVTLSHGVKELAVANLQTAFRAVTVSLLDKTSSLRNLFGVVRVCHWLVGRAATTATGVNTAGRDGGHRTESKKNKATEEHEESVGRINHFFSAIYVGASKVFTSVHRQHHLKNNRS